MAPNDTSYQCHHTDESDSENLCKHKASMECIDHNCSFKLCRKHFKIETENAENSADNVVLLKFGEYKETPTNISRCKKEDGHDDGTVEMNHDTDNEIYPEVENTDGFYIVDDNDRTFRDDDVNDFVVNPIIDGEDGGEIIGRADSDEEDSDVPMPEAGQKGKDVHLKSKNPNNRIHAMVVINGKKVVSYGEGKYCIILARKRDFCSASWQRTENQYHCYFPKQCCFRPYFGVSCSVMEE